MPGHSLRHDLDGATPEQQAIHLALQREVEIDLSNYATQKWVRAQGYLTSVPENPSTPSEPIDLDGYATEEWVTEQLAKPTREERLAFIESQFQYRGLMTLDADGKPEWPADQVKARGGWWAYPTSKYSSIWKYDKLEWIFPHYGEVTIYRANADTVRKTPAQGYQVGDIIRLQVTENESGIYRDRRYVDTAPVFVEYKVEELYYPNKLDGKSNSYYPAYRVSMSGPLHRYSGQLPNEVVGVQADGEEQWIQWYPTVMSYGTAVEVYDDGYATIEYSDARDKAVEDASVNRDEAIQKKFDDESTLNTAAHLRLDGDILRLDGEIDALSKTIDTKLPFSGGTVKGVLSVKHGATGSGHVFSCYAAGLGENQVAFRVTGDGSVKAGQDANHPFMAKSNNDVVTKGYLKQHNSGNSDYPKCQWVAASHKVPEDLERGEFFIGDDNNIYFHRISATNVDLGVSSGEAQDLVFLCSVHDSSGNSVHCMTADQISFNNGENNYSMVRNNPNSRTLLYGEGVYAGMRYFLNIPGFTF